MTRSLHRRSLGVALAGLAAWSCAVGLEAAAPAFETLPLPPLRIDGRPARAHTQGVEVVGQQFYVTARREDVSPRRALLLRTSATRDDWDAWDITPAATPERPEVMDHAGGMQCDGARLWIPVAESRRNGRTLIRAYRVDSLVPGRSPQPDREFLVADHIGALAVSGSQRLLLGASWDTESVYAWELDGTLRRKSSEAELRGGGLGVGSGPEPRRGLAVQDWKFSGDRLFASGMLGNASPRSRLFVFDAFVDSPARRVTIALPALRGAELAREAMAVHDGWIWFLPDDLGPTNRLHRLASETGASPGAR